MKRATEAPSSSVCVALETPDQPAVRELIDALDAYLIPLYPLESHHGLELAQLLDPAVLFAVARLADGEVAGCGALRLMAGYGELKRMYTRPELRGRGIARAVLGFLEAEARARGYRELALETGYLQHEALALYARHGYGRCAPFGDYAPDPNSIFMRKVLPP